MLQWNSWYRWFVTD